MAPKCPSPEQGSISPWIARRHFGRSSRLCHTSSRYKPRPCLIDSMVLHFDHQQTGGKADLFNSQTFESRIPHLCQNTSSGETQRLSISFLPKPNSTPYLPLHVANGQPYNSSTFCFQKKSFALGESWVQGTLGNQVKRQSWVKRSIPDELTTERAPHFSRPLQDLGAGFEEFG